MDLTSKIIFTVLVNCYYQSRHVWRTLKNLAYSTRSSFRASLPPLISCGVESMACHPPYPTGKSGRAIHTSFHTWKFQMESSSPSGLLLLGLNLQGIDTFFSLYVSYCAHIHNIFSDLSMAV